MFQSTRYLNYFYLSSLSLLFGSTALLASQGNESPLIPHKSIINQYLKEEMRDTELYGYVSQSNENYMWEETECTMIGANPTQVEKCTLHMQSQLWSPYNSEGDEWHHRITIYKPQTLQSNHVFMIVGGAHSKQDKASHSVDYVNHVMADFANKIGMVVVKLKDNPNKDKYGRTNDQLTAYSMLQAMYKQDFTPVLFPMVKTIVRSMDTVQMRLNLPENDAHFILFGHSKRGWATWLTAALDNRVAAIMPFMFEGLNLPELLQHTYDSHGKWPETLQDYHDYDTPILQSLETDQGKALISQIDPFQFSEHITAPKYIVTASGSECFAADSSQFYIDQLVGKKWLRALPNKGDNLTNYTQEDINTLSDMVISFANAISQNSEPPTISWQLEDPNLILNLTQKPVKVTLWRAINPESRDFRKSTLDNLNISYAPTDLTKQCLMELSKETTCHITAFNPELEKGWSAQFIEVHFNNGSPQDFIVTTQIIIFPNTYPKPRTDF